MFLNDFCISDLCFYMDIQMNGLTLTKLKSLLMTGNYINTCQLTNALGITTNHGCLLKTG